MILGAVAGLVVELVEDGAGLVHVALLAMDAGLLQLHLTGVVAGLLGLVESLEGLVEFAARGQGAAEVEAGQGAFGLLQMLDGLAACSRGRTRRCRA